MRKVRRALGRLALLILGTVAGATEFSDLPSTHWAHQAVQRAVDLGVLEGYQGKFYGEKLINRYQFAVVAKKCLDLVGYEVAAPDGAGFEDVPRKHWAASAVWRAADAGLIGPWFDATGTAQDAFQGEKLVSRYQVARMTSRLAAAREDAVHLADRPDDVPASDPRLEDVRRALGIGFLETYEGNFHGDKLINRYQLAIVVARLFPEEDPGASR